MIVQQCPSNREDVDGQFLSWKSFVSIRLRRYPRVKSTGLDWLGDVPSHWELAPGFAAFRLRKDRNTGLRETKLLSLSFALLVPPRDEQVAIAQSVEQQISPIAIARASAMREIDLLREYRTRLVTDVVTGKLDVRVVSLPSLPDEPDAPPDPDGAEPVDDPELMDAAEAMAERAAGDALN
ncbi:restriction endonuclease subunit S [Halochromatium glycolicum]|uniref:restriction endonuclease subunit S n=1 Tax=Halochromatium glycolicum TaxID=85075 RepID=UPI00190C280E|nr:hypothetical protein [Halochromatium glycolicum]